VSDSFGDLVFGDEQVFCVAVRLPRSLRHAPRCVSKEISHGVLSSAPVSRWAIDGLRVTEPELEHELDDAYGIERRTAMGVVQRHAPAEAGPFRCPSREAIERYELGDSVAAIDKALGASTEQSAVLNVDATAIRLPAVSEQQSAQALADT
jgi:hypothetical protein